MFDLPYPRNRGRRGERIVSEVKKKLEMVGYLGVGKRRGEEIIGKSAGFVTFIGKPREEEAEQYIADNKGGGGKRGKSHAEKTGNGTWGQAV